MAAYEVLDRRGALLQRSVLCLVYDPERDDDEQFRSFLRSGPFFADAG
jgi:hypothetical protein